MGDPVPDVVCLLRTYDCNIKYGTNVCMDFSPPVRNCSRLVYSLAVSQIDIQEKIYIHLTHISTLLNIPESRL